MAAVYLNFCVMELSFQKSSLVFEVCWRCLPRLQALGMTCSRWERRKAGCGGEVEVTGLRSEVRESGESKTRKTYHAEGSERPGHEPGIKQRVEGAAAEDGVQRSTTGVLTVFDNENQASSTLGCDNLTDSKVSISQVVKYSERNVESWQCCQLTGVRDRVGLPALRLDYQ